MFNRKKYPLKIQVVNKQLTKATRLERFEWNVILVSHNNDT